MSLTSKGADRRMPVRAHDQEPLDERDLTRRMTRGDRRAFATAFRRHHRELHRYCRAILGNAEDAEDALQSTMVKALRALPGETREIALKPWLFRVAHNEAIGLLRARRPSVELDADQVDRADGVDEQAETRERLHRLVGDLGELPDRQRGALVMRELNGIGFAEIGAAFGISEAAAKQTVYEARTSLHRMAEGREMACEPVREAISSEDRRRLRSRRIRAHLRECADCRDFESSIAQRRADLAVLAPPIALPAALAALHGALGGGATAGGGAAVGTGAIGTAAAAKSVAAVLATIAIAGGAAEITGLVSFGGSRGGPDDGAAASSPQAPAHQGQPDVAAGHAPQPTLGAIAQSSRAEARRARGQGEGQGRSDRAEPGRSGDARGRSDDAPGQSDAATRPGRDAARAVLDSTGAVLGSTGTG